MLSIALLKELIYIEAIYSINNLNGLDINLIPDNVTGIYRLTNIKTMEMYIGQSRDIKQRFKEHLYHRQSNIDKAIHDIGKDSFCFEILEICKPEELDAREKFYIEKNFSNIKSWGYNLTSGGKDCIGEGNANAHLTSQMVYDIREAYNNHERKLNVYKRYSDLITRNGFSTIWEGKSWRNIHCDVYTQENIDYYKTGTSIGENGSCSKFSDDEVLELRLRYVSESAQSIYESVKNRCCYNTLQSILWGRTYKNVPIYSKLKKRWIT